MVKMARYLCLAAIATLPMFESVVSEIFIEIGPVSHGLKEETQRIDANPNIVRWKSPVAMIEEPLLS